MFRDNEASRVGAVLERRAAGDIPGMIALATEVWVARPERPGDARDDAAVEVWAAIASAGKPAIDAAVEAALAVVRQGAAIRPHAFVDLTEAMDVPQLAATFAIVLASALPPHPYLAAVMFRLAEMGRGDRLHDLIRTHVRALQATVAHWTLVAFVYATTDVGNRTEVDAWFATWRAYREVPMWIMATYAGSIARLPIANRDVQLAALAGEVYTATAWDATTAYFVPLLGVAALIRGARDEFLSRMRSTTAIGGNAPPPPPLANPIVAYANAAKHRHALDEAAFAWHPGAGVTVVDNRIVQAPAEPREWRIVLIVRALDELVATCDRVLPLFADMIATPRGGRQATVLYREMQRAHLGELPALAPIWGRLARERVPLLRRLWLEYF